MIFFLFYCKWYNIEFVFLCLAYLTKQMPSRLTYSITNAGISFFVKDN